MEATMKITIGALVYLLLASGVTAQAQKPKPATAMSDDFAKTGIKALRTIQGDSHPLGMELEVSKKVSETIDDADAVARGKETFLVAALRHLQLRQEMNNSRLEAGKMHFEVSFQPKTKSAEFQEIELEEAWDKAPEHLALLNSKDFTQVEQCGAGLESLLRSRRVGPIPQACE